MQFVDFITGPVGAAIGWIIPMAGLALLIGLAVANLTIGLNEGARRLGAQLSAVMLAGFPVWLAAFYGTALFVADFDGDWRGVAFAAAGAGLGLWLSYAALRGVARAFHG